MSQHPPASLRLENRHTGEVLELVRRRRGGEVILELRGTLPPYRDGPPLHVHSCEDEEGTVTAGTLSAEVGGRRIDATAGQSVSLPRGIPHRWWNEGNEPLAFVLGTLLGRYRGNEWPGCPARCPGAPTVDGFEV